jgi:hypothetical protein
VSPEAASRAQRQAGRIAAPAIRPAAIVLAATVAWAVLDGAARAQGLADPRAFGAPAGRGGLWLGLPLGLAGMVCTAALGRIRRHHSRRWLRPWFITAAFAPPLLLVGLPLLSGGIASRYLWGSHYADVAVVAATRLMSLAAGAVWLLFEFLAAERQHEQELYAAQRSTDRASRVMRRLAAVLGVVALLSLVQGLSVAVPEGASTSGCLPAKGK